MPSKLAPTNKVQSLEIVRFIAAVSVVIWHYQFYFFDPPSSRSALPFYAIFSAFYNSGLYAVQWFWVLSGYVIFLNYADGIASKRISFARFFLRRFARLYPLHLLTFFIVLFLLFIYKLSFNETYPYYAPSSNWMYFVSQLFLASNWLSTQYTFNGPIWSVSVEVLIYFLFFLVVALAKYNTIKASILVCPLSFTIYLLSNHLGIEIVSWIALCSACFFGGGLIRKIASSPFGVG
jgi:peptidoglycan/LPS O-acetylase OafA/YrhL